MPYEYLGFQSYNLIINYQFYMTKCILKIPGYKVTKLQLFPPSLLQIPVRVVHPVGAGMVLLGC
jgi:hypothetical protein